MWSFVILLHVFNMRVTSGTCGARLSFAENAYIVTCVIVHVLLYVVSLFRLCNSSHST